MNIPFQKYQGTGNDFILIDNRSKLIILQKEQIALLCDRHFGIGADGLMLLENVEDYNFKMVYFNSDGNESTMCGNGGRCITAFAYNTKIIEKTANFLAIDGPHFSEILDNGFIRLQMSNVSNIRFSENHIELNTGSPHYILWVKENEKINVNQLGKSIRQQKKYMPNGINVNFVECTEKGLYVRTFERGVESETLSCGTGVTAAAIASTLDKIGCYSISIITKGGRLKVEFEKETKVTAKNIYLIGPAQKVFEGIISL